MPPKKTLLDLVTGGKYQTSQDIPPLIEGPRMSQQEMSGALSGLDRFLNPPLPENVQAPGLGLLEYTETGPAMGLKAMGSLITSPKKWSSLIGKLGVESDKLMSKYKKAQRDVTNFRRKHQPKGEGYKTSGSISRSDEIIGPIFNSKTKKYDLLDSSTMYRHEFDTERLAKLTKTALYNSRRSLSKGNKGELEALINKQNSIERQLKENDLTIDELILGREQVKGLKK